MFIIDIIIIIIIIIIMKSSVSGVSTMDWGMWSLLRASV